uniref:CCHC-type domain-containing protein n=1 Tax=Tanacetum cinerariifolium TaxID=118510 RepID=A0A699KXR9_TANCI|nr:hypothetical protein [Tanacetum cinerariifolium]
MILQDYNHFQTLHSYKGSIPSEDPYEEAARQLLEQAPRSPEYVPDPIKLEYHVPLHIPEHPEDEAYILEVASAPTPLLPPSFLSLCIRPLHTRAAMAQMRAAVPSTYHSLLPLRTLPLLPIYLLVPSTSRRAEIPKADTPPRKRLLLTAPRPGYEVGESSAAAATNNHKNSTCYQCGNQGHYKSDCLELKNQDHVNQARGTGAREMVHALEGGETN